LFRFSLCCFMLGWLLAGDPAWGEDYWTDCKTAYEFCSLRPYHRDCAIWTHYKQPLSVVRWHTTPPNENASSQFCKENPWHMQCGTRMPGTNERYVEICPLPPY